MIGIDDFLMPIEAAPVARHQRLAVVQAHAVRIGFEQQALAGITCRHRVVIGLEGDAKLTRGTHREYARQIESGGG